MAAGGGCCPLVVPAAPAVGPAAAARGDISVVRRSISVLHGPATATPAGNVISTPAPNRSVVVFMTFSPGHRPKAKKHPRLSSKAGVPHSLESLRCRDNSHVAIRFRKERRMVGHV